MWWAIFCRDKKVLTQVEFSSLDSVKIGLNGYSGHTGIVRGNAIASDRGAQVIPV